MLSSSRDVILLAASQWFLSQTGSPALAFRMRRRFIANSPLTDLTPQSTRTSHRDTACSASRLASRPSLDSSFGNGPRRFRPRFGPRLHIVIVSPWRQPGTGRALLVEFNAPQPPPAAAVGRPSHHSWASLPEAPDFRRQPASRMTMLRPQWLLLPPPSIPAWVGDRGRRCKLQGEEDVL